MKKIVSLILMCGITGAMLITPAIATEQQEEVLSRTEIAKVNDIDKEYEMGTDVIVDKLTQKAGEISNKVENTNVADIENKIDAVIDKTMFNESESEKMFETIKKAAAKAAYNIVSFLFPDEGAPRPPITEVLSSVFKLILTIIIQAAVFVWRFILNMFRVFFK